MENTKESKDKKRTRRWGNIFLFDETLTLPKGVTQVEDIVLSGSASLSIPEGVVKVGDIELYDRSSLTFPKGLTQVGGLYALSVGCSITFPDGYMLKNSGHRILEYSAKEMNQLLSKHQVNSEEFVKLPHEQNHYKVQGKDLRLVKKVVSLDNTMYEYVEFLEKKKKPTFMQAGESIVEKPVKKHQEENPPKMEWQTIDPEGLQGRRIFVIYPEDVSEGRPLPMSVEGRLTDDGKAYVSFSDSNRIVPEDGLIMVKNPNCNIYEAFNRKTFDLLYQMNPDGTASRKKQAETMKPGMRKKSLLKK